MRRSARCRARSCSGQSARWQARSSASPPDLRSHAPGVCIGHRQHRVPSGHRNRTPRPSNKAPALRLRRCRHPGLLSHLSVLRRRRPTRPANRRPAISRAPRCHRCRVWNRSSARSGLSLFLILPRRANHRHIFRVRKNRSLSLRACEKRLAGFFASMQASFTAPRLQHAELRDPRSCASTSTRQPESF
jgi:hypothetical protein